MGWASPSTNINISNIFGLWETSSCPSSLITLTEFSGNHNPQPNLMLRTSSLIGYLKSIFAIVMSAVSPRWETSSISSNFSHSIIGGTFSPLISMGHVELKKSRTFLPASSRVGRGLPSPYPISSNGGNRNEAIHNSITKWSLLSSISGYRLVWNVCADKLDLARMNKKITEINETNDPNFLIFIAIFMRVVWCFFLMWILAQAYE